MPLMSINDAWGHHLHDLSIPANHLFIIVSISELFLPLIMAFKVAQYGIVYKCILWGIFFHLGHYLIYSRVGIGSNIHKHTYWPTSRQNCLSTRARTKYEKFGNSQNDRPAADWTVEIQRIRAPRIRIHPFCHESESESTPSILNPNLDSCFSGLNPNPKPTQKPLKAAGNQSETKC